MKRTYKISRIIFVTFILVTGILTILKELNII